MRFKTKFDRWLVVVLILPAIPLAFLAASGRVAPGVLFLAIWLVVLLCTLPQYYEVRDDGLFLRQGWRKSLLPYPSIVEIQSMTDSRGAGVFSLDRILIVDRNGSGSRSRWRRRSGSSMNYRDDVRNWIASRSVSGCRCRLLRIFE